VGSRPDAMLRAMTVLFLIRHGLAEHTGAKLYGWTPGVHLSEVGRKQAAGLTERFEGLSLAAIYTSPLERCRETAAPLASAHGIEVRTRRELGEVDYGDWTNRSLRQLARTKLWRTVQTTPSQAVFPNGESLQEVKERAIRAVLTIAREHPRAHVAVVSHGDPIRLLVSHAAGAHLDGFQRIAVDPASVSVIAIGEGPPRVYRVNDTGDLRGFVRRKRPGGNVRG
jgi:probable phosphomutase (TIGR03848 family)